jgi:hypothetical protein
MVTVCAVTLKQGLFVTVRHRTSLFVSPVLLCKLGSQVGVAELTKRVGLHSTGRSPQSYRAGNRNQAHGALSDEFNVNADCVKLRMERYSTQRSAFSGLVQTQVTRE